VYKRQAKDDEQEEMDDDEGEMDAEA